MRHVFVISALLGSPLAAAGTEQVVRVPSAGQEMVATLQTPDGAAAPVVLMLHGFTGARDELATDHVPDGVFAYTADRLVEAGYASLRVDFRGSGESTAHMSFAETTFETQITDALAAMAFLEASEAVDGADIFLIGWSQGGLVAAAAAGRSNAPDAVALWNAVGDPKATYGDLMSVAMERGMAAGPDEAVTTKLPWGLEVTLNGAFFDGIETHDAIGEIKGFSGPLFVAQGSQDTTVLPENGEAFIAAHEGPEVLWVAEMDHVFNVFGTGETLTEMVGETIAFFEAHAD